jgi:hypothetical protein
MKKEILIGMGDNVMGHCALLVFKRTGDFV